MKKLYYFSKSKLQFIEIKNYKDKDRINEIFNTVAWVFNRMLEKSER